MVFFSQCVKVNTPGGIVVWGSKDTTTVTFDYLNFNEIIVSDKFHVTVKQGDEYAITVTTNQNLPDFLAIEKKYTVLMIGMKPNHFYKDAVLKATVTLPDLAYLDVNGMSMVEIVEFSPEFDLKIDVTEASRLTGNLTAGNVDLTAKNGSDVTLTGRADFLKAEGLVTCELDMAEFSVSDANIYLSIGTQGIFTINGRFVAELRVGSDMKYSGSAVEEEVVKDESSSLTQQN
jgi:hypothetical protein